MAWLVKRVLISAFVIVHVVAIVAWNLPTCRLRDRLGPAAAYYLCPTGLAQQWGMFAPDPPTNSMSLSAVVRDRRGFLRHFDFPRVGEQPAPRRLWMYRHAKYASKVGEQNGKVFREFAARYVTRRVGLTEADFPIEVDLVLHFEPIVGPDDPFDEPPPMPFDSVVTTYGFPNLAETRP